MIKKLIASNIKPISVIILGASVGYLFGSIGVGVAVALIIIALATII